MDANITISFEEFPDLGGPMGREIIGDDMNFLCRCLTGNDLLEKSHELRASMARGSFAEDFTTLVVERRKERKRPVADNIRNRAALRALGSRAIPGPTYPVLEWHFSRRHRIPLH